MRELTLLRNSLINLNQENPPLNRPDFTGDPTVRITGHGQETQLNKIYIRSARAIRTYGVRT